MAFDNTKYDVELNSVPYRVRSYQKSEQTTFIPRLSPGDQEESDFDLLRSKTIDNFSGGMLQRYHDDDTSVYSIENMYPIYDDGVLYPVNAPTTSVIGAGRAYFNAFCKTKDYVFVAYNRTTGGAGQAIWRIDTSGTATALTLPANLSNATYIIHDMVIWRNQLWICASNTPSGSPAGSMYYMDLSSTTVTDITAGSGFYYRMCVWKDQLYGTNCGPQPGYTFYRYTGDTTTKNFVVLASSPMQTASFYSKLFVFNNRVYLLRNDGMYAWDGTQLVTIEDLTQQVNDENFRFGSVLKGYLYYFMPDGLYRFNGSLIEKLYDRTEVGFPKDMTVGKNRLWIIYSNSAYSGSSRLDKAMGYDYSSGTNCDGRVAVFNGKAMYTYCRTTTFVKSGSPLLAGEGENDKGYWFNDKLYVFTMAEPSSNQFVLDTNETASSGNKSWRIVTSIFDGGFPMIDKNLENHELVLDGNVASDQAILLEYRTSGFDGSTGWTSLGSFQSQTELKRYIWKQVTAGVSFKKIQFRLSGTTDVRYGLAKWVNRFTLAPDMKWQWNMTFLCYGDDVKEPLMLRDGTESSQTVATLRDAIYQARVSDVPVLYTDIDQLDLNGAHNNSTTTITLNSTKLIKGDLGFIKIDDEIMYWSAKTATTLTVVRAQLGTSAASHSDNAKVFQVYRVLIRQLQNERIELQDRGVDETEDKSFASEINLTLQEV